LQLLQVDSLDQHDVDKENESYIANIWFAMYDSFSLRTFERSKIEANTHILFFMFK